MKAKLLTFTNLPPIRWLVAALAIGWAVSAVGCSEPGATTAEAHDHDHGHSTEVATGSHSHPPTPGETCFICDPGKRDAGRLWCREHGRYEDRCWLCHPELEDKDRLFCSGHYLYEDECFLCHPELKEGSAKATNQPADDDHGHRHQHSEGNLAELFCHEHGVAEIECAICQPDLAAALSPGGDMKVRLPSPEAARKAGIETETLKLANTAPSVNAICEAQYNQNTLAKVTPLAGGVIQAVYYDAGDQVETGDVLVELHSSEIAEAKGAYLSAVVELDIRQQTLERETRLKEQKIAAERDFLEARAAHQKAQLAANRLRQQLLNYGVSKDALAEIEAKQDTSARLLIRAPFSGTLIDRNAVIGEVVKAGEPLFTLADLSSHWLVLSIASADANRVRVGQYVDAEFPEMPGITIRGQITWIDSAIDPRTRMVKARAVVEDDGDLIKSGLFGKARIIVGEERVAALAPKAAVQRYGGNAFVFVRDEADLFALRRVDVGASQGGKVEVLAGLEPQEAVVTQGSFIVMSEFLKSRLGAGCAGH